MNVPRELVQEMLSGEKKWSLAQIAKHLAKFGEFGMANTLKEYSDRLEVLTQEESDEPVT